MSRSAEWTDKVVPAQLNFLAIYSPPLGLSEATEREQLAFFWSRDRSKTHDENYQLRQIGLAQGIVNFASTFSTGQAVDSVETEKQRIVLTELETSWWILASIDLTRLPTSSKSNPNDSDNVASFEYSSREVSPPGLLLQQLRRAYHIFLLHHSTSISDLYVRLSREKFCSILETYWTQFAQGWDVLLHGNPASDIYGGIKLAASGQLGVGVGEEDWGSGEREVLEALVRNTDGLRDILLSRYGDDNATNSYPKGNSGRTDDSKATSTPWIGDFQLPEGRDGLCFTGVGALSRESIRDVSEWVHDIFTLGESAYGVGRRRRGRQTTNTVRGRSAKKTQSTQPDTERDRDKPGRDSELIDQRISKPGIPPPIVPAVEPTLEKRNTSVGLAKNEESGIGREPSQSADPNLWRKYALLGYGYSWGGAARNPQTSAQSTEADVNANSRIKDSNISNGRGVEGGSQTGDESQQERPPTLRSVSDIVDPSEGHYIIGLRGGLRSLDDMDSVTNDQESDEAVDDDWNSRLSLRTLYVEFTEEDTEPQLENATQKSQSDVLTIDEIKKRDRVRVVVYVHQPFIYTLLFDPNSPSLSMPSFFQSLHRHLLPLHRPLLVSTSPANTVKRLQSGFHSSSNSSIQIPTGVYSLLHEPQQIATITNLPNIPRPGDSLDERHSARFPNNEPQLTRIEALNLHLHILSNFADTRYLGGGVAAADRERTSKTGRGFWVVWLRITAPLAQPALHTKSRPFTPLEQDSPKFSGDPKDINQPVQAAMLRNLYREVILVRRAGDSSSRAARARQSSSPAGFTSSYGIARLLGRGGDGGGSLSSSSPSSKKVAEGVGAGMGIDTRKYADALIKMLGS